MASKIPATEVIIARHVPSLAERTAFHLISVHRDVMAICRSYEDNLDAHAHEHRDPGTIRHPWLHETSLWFTDDGVESSLEEAEASG